VALPPQQPGRHAAPDQAVRAGAGDARDAERGARDRERADGAGRVPRLQALVESFGRGAARWRKRQLVVHAQ